MSMTPSATYLLLGSFALGILGAVLGAWLYARSVAAAAAKAPPARADLPADAVDRDTELMKVVQASVSSELSGIEAKLLQRIPQYVQQAIQIELQFHTQQQVEREKARACSQERWQAERDERRSSEFRTLLRVLEAWSAEVAPGVAFESPERPQRPPASGASAMPAPAVSARPPELVHTPLPRPQPVLHADESGPELSDEEIDALPAELPVPGKQRKRVLPAPKKPVWRSL
ncbi:hypothetical protein [Variovorax sp. GT1P44]|uniref:hypothetical protein n=1 Tax=Variovorax sp. GT1P44 TaxID=3443742 RepID=UPI003F447338